MNLRLFCGVLIFWIRLNNSSVAEVANKTLICYYYSEAYKRQGDGRFAVGDIDPNLCTHVVYSRLYLDIERNNITSDLALFFNKENGYEKFTELKAKNPQLKVLNFLKPKPDKWNATHLKLMNNSTHVGILSGNVVSFLQQYKLDGITLEFYPSKKDKFTYMKFLETLKNAFLPYGYFLAVEGSPYDYGINEGYDFPSLSRAVDFSILNALQFHSSEKVPKLADPHAPLHRRPWDQRNFSVDFAVSHWISKGFPPEKIILTIPLWGNSWTLSSQNSTPPAPAKGSGTPAIYTKQNGAMSYLEICEAVVSKGWQVFPDPHKRMGPYAVSPDLDNQTWVGYDDPDMAVIKSEYILSKGLGGAAVWDVSLDDFHNKCGGGYNPILTAIQKTLFAYKIDLINYEKEHHHVFAIGGIPFSIAFSILLFFVISMTVILIKYLIVHYCIRNW